jgi:putative DNA primase/helicase
MYALTDLGNGKRFARDHVGTMRHVRAWGSWLAWQGTHWAKGDASAAERSAKATALKIGDEAAGADDPKAVFKWAAKSQERRSIENMLAMARSEDGIAVDASALDADQWVLNVRNGTLDLRTGQLRPHDPADLITKIAPVAFDAAAACPLWTSILERVVPDTDTRAFLKRAVGYALTGDVGEHCLFFLHGTGRNGKSTFVNTLQSLLGDYAREGAPSLLLSKRNESHPTEVAALFGSRFVSCQEVEQGRTWAESTIKSLTGGDRITARRMREDFWEFAPTHKFFVCGNHRPRVRGGDEGIWSRMRLVPFEQFIRESERDPNLPAKLAAELPGILNWAIAGCLEWQKAGLQQPSAVATATAGYREAEDVVRLS